MRFHLPGLPHTEISAEYLACAYTQKVRKFGKMMLPRGHDVILYGGEQTDAVCTEHVTIINREMQKQFFGEHDPSALPALQWNGDLPCWKLTSERAAKEIRKRARPGDFVGLIGGICQRAVADTLPDLLCIEYGVGYEGVFTRYRAFESHAHRHYVQGQLKQGDGNSLDAVIPNYFDMDEFPWDGPLAKEDYYLFLGRMVRRKGPEIAVQATGRIGVRLLLAGQGVKSQRKGVIVADELTLSGQHLRHVGAVGVEQRCDLMRKALAVFVPTQYLEPFGGVVIEAGLCGTPVITSDWGAFPETVIQGVTGFRCNTLAEYAQAALDAPKLDPLAIRQHAERYSLENVAPQFERWLERLQAHEQARWHG